MKFATIGIVILAFVFLPVRYGNTQVKQENQILKEEFMHPSVQSQPRTWWRWLNGNITKEGITKDLEAIKAKGMNGVTLFNLGSYYPKGDVRFLSDEWLEMFDFSVDECERLGLDFSFQMCDGWSTSGGPWVPKEHAMKFVTSSKINIKGGEKVEIELPQPFTNLDFYKDLKVLAFPAIDTSIHYFNAENVKVTFGGRVTDARNLVDGSRYTYCNFGYAKDEQPVIDFELNKPYLFSAINVFQGPRETPVGPQKCELLYSNNGKGFTKVADFTVGDIKGGTAFTPVKAKYFRLKITDWTQKANNGSWAFLSEVEMLSPDNITKFPKINDFDRKASIWHRRREIREQKDVPESMVIKKETILDLSDNFKDGKLSWNAPPGNWTVTRIGYTLTGMVNGPATEEGTGLECDKLNKASVEIFYNGYAGKILKRNKEHTGKTITRLFADSFESMPQNWTEDLPAGFEKFNGYTIDDYLLLLTGEIVESVEESEGFLHDFRNTLSVLLAENYYGHLSELCHKDNVKFTAQIAGEQQMVANPILYAGKVDVPAIEFWIEGKPGNANLFTNGSAIFDAVSASRIYNNPVLPSEAFTYRARDFNVTPAMMKPVGDKAYSYGLNQFEMHTYIHQPDDRLPGWQHYMFGIAWGRNITWWDMAAGELTKYFARVQSILQKGKAVTDILIYTGEEVPNSFEFTYKIESPEEFIPHGFKFDIINAQVLQDMLTVKDKQFILPNGMKYKILVLPPTDKMSLSVLMKIEEFLKAGAVIVGTKPSGTYGINQKNSGGISQLANKLWRNNSEYQGKIYDNLSLSEVLKKEKIIPDFDYQSRQKEAIDFIHTKIADQDFYFLSNQKATPVEIEAAFRQTEKIPEIWLTKDGNIYPQKIYSTAKEHIRMPLHFAPNESKFVVFSPGNTDHTVQIEKDGEQVYPFTEESYQISVSSDQGNIEFSSNGDYNITWSNGEIQNYKVNDIPGNYEIKPPFTVKFDPKWGGPESIVFEELKSWTTHPLPGIKYYSGTAVYEKEFKLTKEQMGSDLKKILQLEKVRETAEIYLNGKKAGVIWSADYSCDISDFVKEGVNTLVIRVANTWNNRIAGDDLHPEKKRFTFYPVKSYSPDVERRPYTENDMMKSGIIGKLKIIFEKEVKMQSVTD